MTITETSEMLDKTLEAIWPEFVAWYSKLGYMTLRMTIEELKLWYRFMNK